MIDAETQTEINRLADELDALAILRRRGAGSLAWTDDIFEANDAKVAAITAEIHRLKRRRHKPASTNSEPPIPFDIDVPPPPVIRREFHFDKMPINGSLVVEAGAAEKTASSAISQFKHRNPGWDYTSKRQPDGTRRFWRLA